MHVWEFISATDSGGVQTYHLYDGPGSTRSQTGSGDADEPTLRREVKR